MDFFQPAFAPFSIALCIMLMIAAIELVGMVFGASFSELIDGLTPDVDIDADIDLSLSDSASGLTDIEAASASVDSSAGLGAFSRFLSWLCIGKVPVLALIVVFLTSFSLVGFVGQSTIYSVVKFYLPSAITGLGALFIALPMTHHFGSVLARIMPKEQTDAVSKESFIGRVAVIIRGTAKMGQAAEAKLKDAKGMVHYILVEPDNENADFNQGDEIILVEQKGPIFRGIKNTNPALGGV